MSGRLTRHRTTMKRFAVRIVAFASLWLVLVEGDLHHLGLAALAIGGAAAMGVKAGVGIGWRLSARGLVRFVPYFVHVSLTSAWDVAKRTVVGRRALDPALIHYRLRLPADGPALTFFAYVTSLIPGTLCAGIDGQDITIHAIDRSQDPTKAIALLERRVAALFGRALGPGSGP